MKIVIQRLEDDQYRKELRTQFGDDQYRDAIIEQLLRAYQNDIFVQCVRWLDADYGEEIAQEVFLRAWQSLLRYRGDSAIKTWLLGIAKNECRKFLRNRGRRRKLREAWLADIRERVHGKDPASPEDQHRGAEEQDAENQKMARLAECLTEIPEKYALLVKWRYLKDLSISEISALLDEKQDTIYKRLQRALQKLEKCMRDGLQKRS